MPNSPVTNFNVAVCDPPLPHLTCVFDALCAALTTRGYRYCRLPQHEFLAQPGLLAQAAVLAGFGGMPVPANTLAAAPQLRGVVSCVSGTDGIDLPAASALGVLVAHAPTPQNARGMAEAAMMLLLNLCYDLDGTRDNFRRGRPRPFPVVARLLQGQHIGLIGWGRIAAALADLLQPWGVRLSVYSRRGTPPGLPAHAAALPLEALLSTADFAVVLVPGEPGQPPLMDRAALARMKPGARLLNLSRGTVIDEAALIDTLQSGQIAGAALDVFAIEPLPADSPLRTLRNVILTPHHVGHTQEADDSLIPALIANVLALLAGSVPPMVRNPEATARWLARFGGHACTPYDAPRIERKPL